MFKMAKTSERTVWLQALDFFMDFFILAVWHYRHRHRPGRRRPPFASKDDSLLLYTICHNGVLQPTSVGPYNANHYNDNVVPDDIIGMVHP